MATSFEDQAKHALGHMPQTLQDVHTKGIQGRIANGQLRPEEGPAALHAAAKLHDDTTGIGDYGNWDENGKTDKHTLIAQLNHLEHETAHLDPRAPNAASTKKKWAEITRRIEDKLDEHYGAPDSGLYYMPGRKDPAAGGYLSINHPKDAGEKPVETVGPHDARGRYFSYGNFFNPADGEPRLANGVKGYGHFNMANRQRWQPVPEDKWPQEIKDYYDSPPPSGPKKLGKPNAKGSYREAVEDYTAGHDLGIHADAQRKELATRLRTGTLTPETLDAAIATAGKTAAEMTARARKRNPSPEAPLESMDPDTLHARMAQFRGEMDALRAKQRANPRMPTDQGRRLQAAREKVDDAFIASWDALRAKYPKRPAGLYPHDGGHVMVDHPKDSLERGQEQGEGMQKVRVFPQDGPVPDAGSSVHQYGTERLQHLSTDPVAESEWPAHVKAFYNGASDPTVDDTKEDAKDAERLQDTHNLVKQQFLTSHAQGTLAETPKTHRNDRQAAQRTFDEHNLALTKLHAQFRTKHGEAAHGVAQALANEQHKRVQEAIEGFGGATHGQTRTVGHTYEDTGRPQPEYTPGHTGYYDGYHISPTEVAEAFKTGKIPSASHPASAQADTKAGTENPVQDDAVEEASHPTEIPPATKVQDAHAHLARFAVYAQKNSFTHAHVPPEWYHDAPPDANPPGADAAGTQKAWYAQQEQEARALRAQTQQELEDHRALQPLLQDLPEDDAARHGWQRIEDHLLHREKIAKQRAYLMGTEEDLHKRERQANLTPGRDEFRMESLSPREQDEYRTLTAARERLEKYEPSDYRDSELTQTLIGLRNLVGTRLRRYGESDKNPPEPRFPRKERGGTNMGVRLRAAFNPFQEAVQAGRYHTTAHTIPKERTPEEARTGQPGEAVRHLREYLDREYKVGTYSPTELRGMHDKLQLQRNMLPHGHRLQAFLDSALAELTPQYLQGNPDPKFWDQRQSDNASGRSKAKE